MPKKKGQRNYKDEYRSYHSKPLQKKRRAQRNAARRKLAADGRVRKGDGKDVDHIKSNRKGNLSNARKNLRVLPKSKNRSRK
jgi:hypothetical protein